MGSVVIFTGDGEAVVAELQVGAIEVEVRLSYPRVHTGPDGTSHFQDIVVPMSPAMYVPGIPLVDVSARLPVTALQFARVAAGYTSDWHHAPRRQYVLVLSGDMELTVADGETRSFGP